MGDMHRHAPEEVTCREFVDLVTEYWEGALPEERLELVEEHLVMCDLCGVYLEQMEDTVAATGAASASEPVPEESERELLAAFRQWRSRR